MSERLTADISRDLRAFAQDMRVEHRNTDAVLLTEAADKLDGLIALLADAEAERDGLRQHILDIDAHATPYGDIPAEPGWVGTYLVTAGALHRALGRIGHTAPKCAAEAERDQARVEHQQALDHLERWRERAWLEVERGAARAETIRKVRALRECYAALPLNADGPFENGRWSRLMEVIEDLDAALGDIPSPTAPEAPPSDDKSGHEWTCRKCGCRLTPCLTCGQPAQCGESWCPGHGPVEPEETPDA